MIEINLTHGGHDWHKQNLVTQIKGRRSFDTLKCSGCGISGKTTSLNTIKLKGSLSERTIDVCKAVRIVSMM